MVYINNLKPRKNILIKNNYFITDNFHIDFHIVIYYLTKYKCRIILRRLDKPIGWDNNIVINIDNEKISIGSSIYNHKIININIKTELFFKNNDYEQKIPKTIIQTHITNNILNILHINSILTFQELNPEYEYIFYNDIDCRKFIKNNFDEDTLYYYDILVAGAFKADFFRYCFMYINGGCYFDCKQILKYSLSNIIKKDSEIFLCQDIHKTGLFNAVLISTPKNKLFLNAIETIKYKIKNFNKIYSHLQNKKEWNTNNVLLSLTGPSLLYDVSIDDNINFDKYVLFKHIKKSDYYNDLYIEYENKKIIVKNYADSKSFGTHYSALWKKNEIIYKNYTAINNFNIFIYPNFNNDFYEFYLLPDNKLCILNKTNSYWKYHFKIKIIDNNNHKENFLIINPSNNSFIIIDTNLNFNIDNLLIDYIILDKNSIDKKLLNIFVIKNNNNFYLILYNFINLLDNLELNLKINNYKDKHIKLNKNLLKNIIIKKINLEIN
jgi:mannosyltransferase OCH1-like enzyme